MYRPGSFLRHGRFRLVMLLAPVLIATAPTTLRSWTNATDGHRQATVMTGTDERGGKFSLATGRLHPST